MTLKQYRLIEYAGIILIAAVIVLAVLLENPWIPAPVLVVFLVIGLYLRSKVKELATDERNNVIAEKALAFAGGLYVILATAAGLTLIVLGRSQGSVLEPVGYTLAASAAGLMIVYYLASLHFSGIRSGKE